MIRKEYISGSAGALVVGAVALVLGFALNPLPQDENLSDELLGLPDLFGKWLSSSIALFIASIGLTLGIACLLSLMAPKDHKLRVVTAIVFATGTVCMAGYAIVLLFLRALVINDSLPFSALNQLADEDTVRAYLGVFLLSFMAGIVLVAVGLWRSGLVPRWVPVLMLVFVASQFAPVAGNAFTVVQFIVLAVALAGAAVTSNDHAHELEVASRPLSHPGPLTRA